jgi:hypothetical protein
MTKSAACIWPFLLQVLHGLATLDDIEAAGLLHHHAQQRGRRAQAVVREMVPAVLRLGHGQHAQLLGALLDRRAGLLGLDCGRQAGQHQGVNGLVHVVPRDQENR